MRVTCKANLGTALPGRYFEEGYTPESVFHLVIGKEYCVFGIELYRFVILALVADETHMPNWCPIDLFTVSDPNLPSNWYFAYHPETDFLVRAIWGYEQLVSD